MHKSARFAQRTGINSFLLHFMITGLWQELSRKCCRTSTFDPTRKGFTWWVWGFLKRILTRLDLRAFEIYQTAKQNILGMVSEGKEINVKVTLKAQRQKLMLGSESKDEGMDSRDRCGGVMGRSQKKGERRDKGKDSHLQLGSDRCYQSSAYNGIREVGGRADLVWKTVSVGLAAVNLR